MDGNCTFVNVNAEGTAAVVVALHANAVLQSSQFVNCSASYAVVVVESVPLLNGSFAFNETLTVDDCHFLDCSGVQSVLYMLGKDEDPTQQLNVFNSRFHSNSAYYGAAITTFAEDCSGFWLYV